jgi:hypothetical protein
MCRGYQSSPYPTGQLSLLSGPLITGTHLLSQNIPATVNQIGSVTASGLHSLAPIRHTAPIPPPISSIPLPAR